MMHFLKQWPQYFEQVRLKRKTFEIRKDDRGFMFGDKLCLEEWVPMEDRPLVNKNPPGFGLVHEERSREGSTGRFIITAPIPYITRGPSFGLEAGHVIMSIVPETLLESLDPAQTLTRATLERYLAVTLGMNPRCTNGDGSLGTFKIPIDLLPPSPKGTHK